MNQIESQTSTPMDARGVRLEPDRAVERHLQLQPLRHADDARVPEQRAHPRRPARHPVLGRRDLEHDPGRSRPRSPPSSPPSSHRYGPHGSFWTSHPTLTKTPITTFELWNEPYYDNGDNGDYNPGRYARLVKAAGAAGHAADPSAKFLIAAENQCALVSGTWVWWIDALYQAVPDLNNYFDGVAVHPYGTDLTNVSYPTPGQAYNGLRPDPPGRIDPRGIREPQRRRQATLDHRDRVADVHQRRQRPLHHAGGSGQQHPDRVQRRSHHLEELRPRRSSSTATRTTTPTPPIRRTTTDSSTSAARRSRLSQCSKRIGERP